MAFKYKFTQKASEDLDDVLNYISVNLCNHLAANDLFNHIFKTIDNIINFPLIYPIISNEFIRRKDVRKAIVDNYNLYYIVENNIIYVLRIIYNKRGLTKIISF